MEYIYSALEFISNVGDTILNFFDTLILWVKNIFAYAGYYIIHVYLTIKIFMADVALSIARELLSDYGVYTLVETNFNALPTDVRFILTEYGVTTGLRIIFDAFATSLVMRFMGW